jgi:hypothetical protein
MSGSFRRAARLATSCLLSDSHQKLRRRHGRDSELLHASLPVPPPLNPPSAPPSPAGTAPCGHTSLSLSGHTGLSPMKPARSVPARTLQACPPGFFCTFSGLAPSEHAVAVALRNTLPEVLATAANTAILVEFIRDRLDLSGAGGRRSPRAGGRPLGQPRPSVCPLPASVPHPCRGAALTCPEPKE